MMGALEFWRWSPRVGRLVSIFSFCLAVAMKLKELPTSLMTAWRLNRMDVAQLHQPSAEILPIIVSLTSIPSRLPIIHLTIRSLLAQSHKPQKIVLWLNEQLQQQIPASLKKLIGPLFEIRYVDLTCSHRKLIHALDAFPETTIVTCDDDLMYNANWLKPLYDDHVQFPRDIIAHECRVIAYDAAGKVKPYREWKLATQAGFTSEWLMPIGFGGVLYPPHCLHADATNRELFLRLTPKADDLWFKAMSYRAGTRTRRCSYAMPKPIPIAGSQKVSLKKTNVRQDGNYLQWVALVDYFSLTPAQQQASSEADHS